jgi:type III restriction enzyme
LRVAGKQKPLMETRHAFSLAAYGPGAADMVNLEQWRAKVRVQQVTFTMAKVLMQQWLADRGDVIPTHRLFPQLLGYTARFLAEKLKLSGNRAAQDVALNPYLQQAVAPCSIR